MSLKKFLLIPLVISMLLFAYFSGEVIRGINTIFERITFSPQLFGVVVLAVGLQIVGHIIRAYKLHFLLTPVRPSTTRFQFRALSLGYLFNTLLPFRMGELIRAQVIASAEKLSLGFAIVLIVIERALDAIILALLGLTITWITGISLGALNHVSYLIMVSLLVFLILNVIGKEDLSLLRLWHKFSALFNESLKTSIRFKAWSVIYGMQRIVSRRKIAQYIGLSLLSWVFYLLSVAVFVQYFFGGLSLEHKAKLSLSPYYGVSIPAGPANLGVYSDAASHVTQGVALTRNDQITYNLVTWALLVLPTSLIGIIFLFTKTKETLWTRLPKQASQQALSDKLLRMEDVSSELEGFLDNYFSGNSLSHIVHRLELRPDFRLLKYFKGGSDAITILALQGKEVVVKKIIPLDFQDRLQAQYDWLTRRQKSAGIVRPLREQHEKNFYAIDLEYDEHNEMFFDYMHRSELADSQRVLDAVWSHLRKSLYRRTKKVIDKKALKNYIDIHIFGCMDKAAVVDDQLILAAKPAKILINGKSYHNLYQIVKKIMSHEQAMHDLATYSRSNEVHGDVAVDNILVSRQTGEPLIIDPAPDGNIITGPAFDFGKMMQSLYCGYEFIFRSSEAVGLGDDGKSINYHDRRSNRYMQLCEYVRSELAPKYLSEAEQKAILFHAGTLHIRRLKHQVYQNPANTLALYAVGVKTLNDFLAQYD